VEKAIAPINKFTKKDLKHKKKLPKNGSFKL